MPSTAHDAAGLLNAAFESNRPTVFFYPKTLLNDSEHTTSENVQALFHWALLGKLDPEETSFVSWGNTVAVCEKTADALEKVGINQKSSICEA